MLNLLLRTSRPPRLLGILLALPLFLPALELRAGDRAEDLTGAVRLLARRVAAVEERERGAALLWENRSSVSESKSQALKELFSEELAGESRRAPAEARARTLRVVLADTPVRVLLVATVPTAHGDDVRIGEAPRTADFLAPGVESGPRLAKELIWQSAEPILDAIEYPGADGKTGLLILEPQRAVVYTGGKEHWELHDQATIPGTAIAERDPRGEIWFNPRESGEAKVVLPGRICELKLAEPLALHCRAAEPSWRDGLFLTSPCDHTTLWLRADSGDRTAPDRLFLGRPSAPLDRAISEMELPGPVLSLSSGQAFVRDTAVVRNISTGNHEVYRISIACGE